MTPRAFSLRLPNPWLSNGSKHKQLWRHSVRNDNWPGFRFAFNAGHRQSINVYKLALSYSRHSVELYQANSY